MSVWGTLGIARTDDLGEIRRAYAHKLKATDVDADPDAFIALRQAFEHALAEAEGKRRRRDAQREADEVAPHLPSEAPPTKDAAAPVEPDAQSDEDPNARFITLGNLLFLAEGTATPDPDALADAVREILDHPEMDQVDRSASVEIWLAQLLHDTIPISDPITPMVIDHFHWDQRTGQWDQPWLFEALVKRHNAFRLLDAVAYRSHPLHAAYRDLTSEKSTRGLRPFGRRRDVTSLLNKIRTEAPLAEAYLNPHRVALWEGRAAGVSDGTGANWVWLAVIALSAVARLASALNTPTVSTAPPSPFVTSSYSSPDLDIDPFVQDASDNSLHFADLDRRNPTLHDRLLDRWNQASDRHDARYLFSGDIRTIIEEAVAEGLRGGSYAVQADYWRLRADELRWWRNNDVESCGQSIRGGVASRTLPVEFSNRRHALQVRVLGEAPHNPAPPAPSGTRGTFSIPGPVVSDALRRSGLSETVLNGGFLGRGTSAQICAAHIALLDAALAQPERQGARLLRDMSRGL